MRIKSIDIARFDAPLRLTFKHSSASRSCSENVVAIVTSESGAVGYGEGCPRPYVTGETQASVSRFFERHRRSVIERITDLPGLESWIAEQASDIDRNPAAFCALELALLDLLGRESGCPVEALLGLAPIEGEFRYSAVLGDSDPMTFRLQYWRYRIAGFRDFKVKICGDLERDRSKLRPFRRSGDTGLRLRLDANNHWQDTAECIAFLKALDCPIFAVEEPLQANRLGSFAAVADALGTKIILDESFLRLDQFEALDGRGHTWIVNCRVSKLGGLLRSMQVVKRARELGLGVIVGAHVGETSLLSRAGLTLAHGAGETLIAQEGAFGTHLLREDVCRPVVMFGRAGVLTARKLLDGRAGLGLQVNLDALAPLARNDH